MFRYDDERETWVLVDASGWNAKYKYVWGRVDRPGIYAAVALPKDTAKLRRVGAEAFARRTIRAAVTKGHFSKAADFADRNAFRDFFIESNKLDEDSVAARKEINLAMEAHRQAVRNLRRGWEAEPLGGKPQWAVLEDIVLSPARMCERRSTSIAFCRSGPSSRVSAIASGRGSASGRSTSTAA